MTRERFDLGAWLGIRLEATEHSTATTAQAWVLQHKRYGVPAVRCGRIVVRLGWSERRPLGSVRIGPNRGGEL